MGFVVKFALLFVLCFSSAEGATHEIRDGKARFTIGYSGGTHEGFTSDISGHFSKTSGLIRVPIGSIRTGDKTRDCHMREALGLDYDKSKFPEEHVCTEEDTLPDSGPNAISYPYIDFRVTGIADKGDLWEVTGEWRIHGITRPVTIPFEVERREDGLRAEAETELLLSEFQVEVKPVKVLFLTIRSFDKVRLRLELVLAPESFTK